MDRFVTLDEAQSILAERGVLIYRRWLNKIAADGRIPGAVKIGSPLKGTWLVPRHWAETYVKVKPGRPRRDVA